MGGSSQTRHFQPSPLSPKKEYPCPAAPELAIIHWVGSLRTWILELPIHVRPLKKNYDFTEIVTRCLAVCSHAFYVPGVLYLL